MLARGFKLPFTAHASESEGVSQNVLYSDGVEQEFENTITT